MLRQVKSTVLLKSFQFQAAQAHRPWRSWYAANHLQKASRSVRYLALLQQNLETEACCSIHCNAMAPVAPPPLMAKEEEKETRNSQQASQKRSEKGDQNQGISQAEDAASVVGSLQGEQTS